MAKKKVQKEAITFEKKFPPTLKQQLETLRATMREYFQQIKYRQAEYSIKLPAKVAVENNVPREHMVNVPSLIASVITAQGLGKEVRVRAVQDPTGGALLIEFFSPIRIERQGPNLLS